MWLAGRWVEMFDMKRALYAEGDGGEGAGDDGGKGGDDKSDITKQFTEFATNTNKTLTTLMNELKGLKKGDSTKALEAKITALEAKLNPAKQDADSEESEETEEESAKSKVEGKKTVDPDVAALRKQIKQLEADSKKHQENLTAEQQRREVAETKHRNSELDRHLAEALTEVKAINIKDATKFLKSDSGWTDKDGEWVFTDGDEEVSISVAVEKLLPKYMREPVTRRGGSGGQGSGLHDTSSKAQLQQIAIDAGILAKKMRGADEYVSTATAAKRAAVEAGVDPQVIVRAIMAAPAA